MPASNVTIINRLGLHARAAAKFVQTAARFASNVTVTRDEKSVNGKSIMGVMTLAAAQGCELTITTDGEDADAALTALVDLVADKFGEPA